MADSKLADLTENTSPADGDLLYLVADPAGTPVDRKITIANLRTAMSPWTLVVNESGASIANWTSVAGTWSSDGTVIKQTDTTGAYRALKYNSEVPPASGLIAQAEVRFPTAATADRRAMLAPASSGAIASTNDPWAGLGENVDQAWIQQGDQATVSEALTVNEDTWYTIRASLLGVYLTVSVDGTMVNARRMSPGALTATDRFMLVNYTGEVHYRNIKVWRLNGPA